MVRKMLSVLHFWVQAQVRSGQIKMEKVAGAQNPGDALTKHLTGPDLMKHIGRMNLRFEDGRPQPAPQLTSSLLKSLHDDKEVLREQRRRAKHSMSKHNKRSVSRSPKALRPGRDKQCFSGPPAKIPEG